MASPEKIGLVRWDLDRRAAPRKVRGSPAWIFRFNLAPDGRFAVAGLTAPLPRSLVPAGADKTERHRQFQGWDVEEERLLWVEVYPEERYATIPGMTADGRCILFICGEESSHLEVRDVATGQKRLEIPVSGEVRDHALVLPDGRFLAGVAASDGLHLCCWDLNNGRSLMDFAVGIWEFLELAFTPDGTRVAVGSREEVILMDVATGDVARTFPRRLADAGGGDLSGWRHPPGRRAERPRACPALRMTRPSIPGKESTALRKRLPQTELLRQTIVFTYQTLIAEFYQTCAN